MLYCLYRLKSLSAYRERMLVLPFFYHSLISSFRDRKKKIVRQADKLVRMPIYSVISGTDYKITSTDYIITATDYIITATDYKTYRHPANFFSQGRKDLLAMNGTFSYGTMGRKP